jgi:hypothetical protein
LWLNIGLRDIRAGNDNFPLKTANDDIQRATGKQIRVGIVKARVSKLPVSSSMGEVRQRQAC